MNSVSTASGHTVTALRWRMSAVTELEQIGIDVRAQRPRVARALLHIADRYRGPVTAAEIAAAAGYGERGLQEAFQRDLRLAPSRVVLLLRLERARLMLLSNPDQPIGSVAAAVGIAHFGRFSGYYRAQYGETPSDTVHAARHRLYS